MKKNGKKEEQDLIEKTAKIYQSITHDSIDGFWIIDMQGHFLDVNDAYCRLIGYSRIEILRMKISDIEIKEESKIIAKYIKQIKKTGKGRFFTQHRKKNGAIIDIEVSASYINYFGGLIFVFLRDFTEIKKTEREQYKNRANSRKMVEEQLTESYKHLGKINREISLLLELRKYPRSKKYRQKIIDHILNLAMNISNAPTGYLYGSKQGGKYDLLSYKGIKEENKEKIMVISVRKIKLLKHLLKERVLISGDIKRYEAELLVLDNKLEYFVTLPLSKGASLGGFIFLGFNKKENVDVQDLEFLDVFAMHASNALNQAGILK